MPSASCRPPPEPGSRRPQQLPRRSTTRANYLGSPAATPDLARRGGQAGTPPVGSARHALPHPARPHRADPRPPSPTCCCGRECRPTRSPSSAPRVSASGPLAATRGWLLAGTIVVSAFALSDTLDGTMARRSGRSSAWGAFLDSTLDRVADAAVFGGLVLWFTGGGDDRPTALLALACLVLGGLVSYARARAEGLGMRADVGIAERTDRLVAVLARHRGRRSGRPGPAADRRAGAARGRQRGDRRAAGPGRAAAGDRGRRRRLTCPQRPPTRSGARWRLPAAGSRWPATAAAGRPCGCCRARWPTPCSTSSPTRRGCCALAASAGCEANLARVAPGAASDPRRCRR